MTEPRQAFHLLILIEKFPGLDSCTAKIENLEELGYPYDKVMRNKKLPISRSISTSLTLPHETQFPTLGAPSFFSSPGVVGLNSNTYRLLIDMGYSLSKTHGFLAFYCH